MLILLGLERERLVTIDEIARSYGISQNHLMKVVHRLGLRGYIVTVRGKNGGVRLASAPERIGIGDVVRDFEQGRELVECFDETGGSCVIVTGCSLKGLLGESLAAFFAVLDGYTLANLLECPGKLRKRLHLSG